MRFRKNLLFFSVISLIAFSCDTGDPEPSINDLSEFAQKFMSMRMGSPNAMSRNSEAAINQSFQSMMSSHGFNGGRLKSDSTGDDSGNDSTVFQDPWASCANITQTQNGDGSSTTIYDYGDGCEEGWGDFKYFMHGKTIQTYKYVSEQTGSVIRDEYLFKTVYDNYGGHYNVDSSEWNMDGNSFYEGYSLYDQTLNKFSGQYSYSDTSLYTYSNNGTYDYKSKGKSHYNETGWVVEESDYEYGDGLNYYRSHVAKPLISNYSCTVFDKNGVTNRYVWVAVSGREIVSYKQDGKEGTFEIDYGNGECDNIIYITEDGKRVAIDLGPGWFFCGTMEG